jgi:16S rRNA (cytidine1402-2'-O)-methyltransferase
VVEEAFSMENRENRKFSFDGQSVNAPILTPGLYLVSTPIGNLDDITIRALKTLAAADVIACEDTRKTQILLRHYGIRAQLVSYNDVNGEARRPDIIRRLAEGAAVALVSDAGTPLVSDPGYGLVSEAVSAELDVMAIPGSSALLAALIVSGCATDRFLFAGFLPVKSGARRRQLEQFKGQRATVVLYEGPSRILACLDDVAHAFGPDHYISVSREITKVYESNYRGTVVSVHEQLSALDRIRGELVLVIDKFTIGEELSEDAIDEIILARLAELSVKQVAQELSVEFGLPRRQIYQRALKLAKQQDEPDGSS